MGKMRIVDMKSGTKFLTGMTPCMKLQGLGPTGHASLITGAINHAVLQPEDRFEVIEEDSWLDAYLKVKEEMRAIIRRRF